VSQRLAAVAALGLLGRDRGQSSSTTVLRVASDRVNIAFEMGGPESRSGVGASAASRVTTWASLSLSRSAR
jgi:hypothetical protein